MAKKKRVVKKRPAVKSKSVSKSKSSVKPQSRIERIFSRYKLSLVIKNLVVFVLLFLISWILYAVVISKESVLSSFFGFLWVVFAFVSLAFFIAMLVLLLLKWMRK